MYLLIDTISTLLLFLLLLHQTLSWKKFKSVGLILCLYICDLFTNLVSLQVKWNCTVCSIFSQALCYIYSYSTAISLSFKSCIKSRSLKIQCTANFSITACSSSSSSSSCQRWFSKRERTGKMSTRNVRGCKDMKYVNRFYRG